MMRAKQDAERRGQAQLILDLIKSTMSVKDLKIIHKSISKEKKGNKFK